MTLGEAYFAMFYTTLIIGVVGISIYNGIGYSIVCEPLKASINYSIISTNCISNNTQVLVEIVNCKDINSVGFLIEKQVNFTFKKTCWYKSKDVDCNQLKSDTIYDSNMTVVYDSPLEIQMWNNYIACLNFQRELFSVGNTLFGPLLGLSLFFMLILFLLYPPPWFKLCCNKFAETKSVDANSV